MKYFAGMFVHRIDGKGRTSIPAKFRALLEQQGGPEMMVFPSYTDGALEACSRTFLDEIYERLQDEDPMGEAMDDLATHLFGSTEALTFDKDGRVVLPPDLRESINVTDQVAFLGRADRFLIMEPAAAKDLVEQARIRSREKHRGVLARRRPAPRTPTRHDDGEE